MPFFTLKLSVELERRTLVVVTLPMKCDLLFNLFHIILFYF